MKRLGLVSGGARSHRRIDRVAPGHVEIDGVRLPRSAVKGTPVEGQWVTLKLDGAQLKAEIDLDVTLRAESRLTDLFQALTRSSW